MRILVVAINYAPDFIGMAKYNTETCEALAAFGHDVRVITAPPYYPQWQIPENYRGFRFRDETINSVVIKRVPIFVSQAPSGAKRLLHHASFALTSAAPTIAAALRWRPELVLTVAPSLMSAALPAWLARRTGAISWLHLQDFEVDAAFDLGILQNSRLRAAMTNIEGRVLRAFDHVSSLTPQMLARLAAKGVKTKNLRELRNWTDTDAISPGERCTAFRSELGLDHSHYVGLYSGAMSSKQGLDLIVDAATELEQTNPLVRFILCGQGPFRTTLESTAAKLSNIRFIDLQPDHRFVELLRTADFHLIPQKAQAADLVLPSKLGGVLASGRPVIVMADQGTGLAHEVTGAGLVIPPGDVAALMTAVRQLTDDPDLHRSLSEGARRMALSRWDKNAILATLNGDISTLVSQKIAAKNTSSSNGPSLDRANETR